MRVGGGWRDGGGWAAVSIGCDTGAETEWDEARNPRNLGEEPWMEGQEVLSQEDAWWAGAARGGGVEGDGWPRLTHLGPCGCLLCSWTSSFRVAWAGVRNAESQAPPRTS